MLIKNLTPNLLELKFRTLGCGDEFDVYLYPHGVAEFEKPTILLNAAALEGKISFDGVATKEQFLAVVEDIEEESVDTNPAESNLNDEENSGEDDKNPPEKFICDECKAEFASARGLAAHKAKTHPAE